MSTRLRPIAMINDSITAGGNVRIALEGTARILKINFPPRGSMPEAERLVRIFDSMPWDQLTGKHWLWLFREPRNTPACRSRYVQLCQYYGVRSYAGKKKKSFEEALDNAIRQRQQRIISDTAARIVAEQQREVARLQAEIPTDWYQPLTTNWASSPAVQQQMAAQQQGISLSQVQPSIADTNPWIPGWRDNYERS